MDIIKVITIFIAIMIIVSMNKPLYLSIGAGILVSLILYHNEVPFSMYPGILKNGFIGKQTIVVVLSFYTITFLQRMLEKRGKLILAEKSVRNIFNSRRINATLVPFIIGLLPAAGAVLIAYPIVVRAAGEYLDKDEVTFVTSYYRHISESFVPTYTSIILALTLSGVTSSEFVLGMLPMVVALFLVGYFFYVRKIPNDKEDIDMNINKKEEWINLFKSLLTLVGAVLIILIFKFPVHYTIIGIIIVNFFLDKFTFEEILPFFKTAFEPKLIFTTIAVMIFKEVLIATGLIIRLPSYFVNLPIPLTLIYAILFFLGSIIMGSQATITTMIPLIYGSIQHVGLGYFIFLMSINFIAMQISPTHVCLGIVSDNAGTTFNGLVKKTLPVLGVFIVICAVYAYVLDLFI